MNNVSEEEIDRIAMYLTVKWLIVGMSLLMAVVGITAEMCAIVGIFDNNLLIFFVSVGMTVAGFKEIIALLDKEEL